MDKGKGLLLSIGIGMILMAFLDFSMPIYISAGLAVFVTILALHDLIGDEIFSFKIAPLDENENLTDKTIYYLAVFFSKVGTILIAFVNIIYIFSVPISIYAAYNSHLNRTVEEINNAQQSLTLYSLGIVIITINFHRSNTK